MKVIIIGAGISGLTLAWKLQREHEITLLEASDRVGGWIRSYQHRGAVFECGPRSMRLGEVPPMVSELKLELVEAGTLRKYLAINGKLKEVPESLFQLMTTSLGRMCLKGLLRFPFSRGNCEDESVQAYFTRRCGQEFNDTFIDPLMAGIWATSPAALSYQACFPKRKRGAKIVSVKGGLQTLPDAIASRLQADVQFNTRVTALSHRSVETTRGVFEGDRVISTVGKIIPGYTVPQTSLITVSLGFEEASLPVAGFGFLASSKEEPELLGVVFDSEIFPSMNGPFKTRLSVMLGGGRAPHLLHLSDAALQLKAQEYIYKYLNIRAIPQFSVVSRAIDAIPAFPVGYLAERAELIKKLAPQGIELFGAQFYNPSIAAILTQPFS